MSKKNKNKKSTNTYTNSTTTCTTPSIGKQTWYNPNGFKKEQPYVYMGKKNKTDFPEFVEICKKSQKELKEFLCDKLLSLNNEVIDGDGFIYMRGTIPVLLTAHMDTVHKETVEDFYEHVDKNGKHTLASPQGIGGDDRCGIYMILKILEKGYRPYVLFCEDEEIGGVGSDKFCKTEFISELVDMKYFVELDRANANDAVFYDCANDEFSDYIVKTTGYKEAWGSFSDISNLAPACKVAAVNLSCGYYSAHTTREEVVVEEMMATVEVVEKLINDLPNVEQFEYIEGYVGGYYKDLLGYGYGGYGYGGYNSARRSSSDDYEVMTEISFWNGIKDKEDSAYYEGTSESACLVQFFKNHPDVCWNDVLDYITDYI